MNRTQIFTDKHRYFISAGSGYKPESACGGFFYEYLVKNNTVIWEFIPATIQLSSIGAWVDTDAVAASLCFLIKCKLRI